jgi:hypothetical protein
MLYKPYEVVFLTENVSNCQTDETVVLYFCCFTLHLFFTLLQFSLLNAQKAFAVASRGSASNPAGGALPIGLVGYRAPSAFDVSVPIRRLDWGMFKKLLTLHAKHCFTLSL